MFNFRPSLHVTNYYNRSRACMCVSIILFTLFRKKNKVLSKCICYKETTKQWRIHTIFSAAALWFWDFAQFNTKIICRSTAAAGRADRWRPLSRSRWPRRPSTCWPHYTAFRLQYWNNIYFNKIIIL